MSTLSAQQRAQCIILDSAVERVRECVWAADWQGATTRRSATCKEAQRRQAAAQACYRVRSDHHLLGGSIEIGEVKRTADSVIS